MIRLGAVLALIAALVTPAAAQRGPRGGEWVPLGVQRVGFGVDRDVINIGQTEEWFRNRAFRTLRFDAEHNDIHMMSVRLVYINGAREDIRIDQNIRRGTGINVDLPGERSYLRQIEMVYRSKPSFRGEALVRVSGETAGRRHDDGPGRFREPVLLGEKSVGFGVDRDVIEIGRDEGWYRERTFRELKFEATGNDVHLMGVRLVYLNGASEDLRIDQRIPVGSQLAVSLRGDRSYIRAIEMTYRARRGFNGRANVRVWGIPGPRR